MKKFIYVTNQYAGFHTYEKAPDVVKFLSYPHRHVFKFKVILEVKHNDRDLEFFMVQDKLMRFIQKNFNLKDLGSCETQAEMMFEFLTKIYPGRPYSVEVSEDGENGAIVSRD